MSYKAKLILQDQYFVYEEKIGSFVIEGKGIKKTIQFQGNCKEIQFFEHTLFCLYKEGNQLVLQNQNMHGQASK